MRASGGAAERVVGRYSRVGAPCNVGLEQAARRLHEPPQIAIGQPLDGCERVDTADEEDL